MKRMSRRHFTLHMRCSREFLFWVLLSAVLILVGNFLLGIVINASFVFFNLNTGNETSYLFVKLR